MKRTLTAITGQQVLVTTDETLTLALGAAREESTPHLLTQLFTRRTLKALRARTRNQSEQIKLDRAIATHEGKI